VVTWYDTIEGALANGGGCRRGKGKWARASTLFYVFWSSLFVFVPVYVRVRRVGRTHVRAVRWGVTIGGRGQPL